MIVAQSASRLFGYERPVENKNVDVEPFVPSRVVGSSRLLAAANPPDSRFQSDPSTKHWVPQSRFKDFDISMQISKVKFSRWGLGTCQGRKNRA